MEGNMDVCLLLRGVIRQDAYHHYSGAILNHDVTDKARSLYQQLVSPCFNGAEPARSVHVVLASPNDKNVCQAFLDALVAECTNQNQRGQFFVSSDWIASGDSVDCSTQLRTLQAGLARAQTCMKGRLAGRGLLVISRIDLDWKKEILPMLLDQFRVESVDEERVYCLFHEAETPNDATTKELLLCDVFHGMMLRTMEPFAALLQQHALVTEREMHGLGVSGARARSGLTFHVLDSASPGTDIYHSNTDKGGNPWYRIIRGQQVGAHKGSLSRRWCIPPSALQFCSRKK
jgi:hypothetical protein